MLMMFEKGIRGGICHAVYRYATANNKYMKNYDKNIESSYLTYSDANNLYGQAMSQKLAVDNSKWIEKDNLLKCDEKFIKNYDEVYIAVQYIFLKQTQNIQKIFISYIVIYHSYQEK